MTMLTILMGVGAEARPPDLVEPPAVLPEVRGQDGPPMVLVPAGEFLMGTVESLPGYAFPLRHASRQTLRAGILRAA